MYKLKEAASLADKWKNHVCCSSYHADRLGNPAFRRIALCFSAHTMEEIA